MDLESAIFQWASQQEPLKAILGGTPFRFWKLRVPQGARMPSTVIQRTAARRDTTNCAVDQTASFTVQLDHYSRDKAARNLADVWRTLLLLPASQFPVLLGGLDSPPQFVKLRRARLDTELDLDDIEPGLTRRSQFWTLWISEVPLELTVEFLTDEDGEALTDEYGDPITLE